MGWTKGHMTKKHHCIHGVNQRTYHTKHHLITRLNNLLICSNPYFISTSEYHSNWSSQIDHTQPFVYLVHIFNCSPVYNHISWKYLQIFCSSFKTFGQMHRVARLFQHCKQNFHHRYFLSIYFLQFSEVTRQLLGIGVRCQHNWHIILHVFWLRLLSINSSIILQKLQVSHVNEHLFVYM